ncbi:hypothetical protein E2C01_047096 [Portunus trituberculatus]|uniref:Uncharacterized protein n=1 Tax=Portunus trituberculatus TaxID=210409 RepID=A0A5B7G7W0_PORTR|nr:hypothetical protein [Portunus trituberculatus]
MEHCKPLPVTATDTVNSHPALHHLASASPPRHGKTTANGHSSLLFVYCLKEDITLEYRFVGRRHQCRKKRSNNTSSGSEGAVNLPLTTASCNPAQRFLLYPTTQEDSHSWPQ